MSAGECVTVVVIVSRWSRVSRDNDLKGTTKKKREGGTLDRYLDRRCELRPSSGVC